jgi:hypothetical protein
VLSMLLAGVAFAASAWICFHTNTHRASANLCGGGNKINSFHLLHYHIIPSLGRILFDAFSINPSTRAVFREAQREKRGRRIYFTTEMLGLDFLSEEMRSWELLIDTHQLRPRILFLLEAVIVFAATWILLSCCTATHTYQVIAKKYTHTFIKLQHIEIKLQKNYKLVPFCSPN